MRCKSLVLAGLAILVLGCGPEGPPRGGQVSQDRTTAAVTVVQDPPDSVLTQLQVVVADVDPAWPGASSARLRAFLAAHSGYTTDAVVHENLAELAAVTEPRYLQARDLAREGAFDEAEAILQDLATHLPESPGGEKARDHLSFEFHIGKAQHHLYRQRFAEAGRIVAPLRERDLDVQQARMVEQILDNVGHVTAAMSVIERQQAEGEVRQILVALMTEMVTEGEFPPDLTLPQLRRSRWFSGSLESIAQLRDYRVGNGTVSFTAVTPSGHRVRVVEGQLQRGNSR